MFVSLSSQLKFVLIQCQKKSQKSDVYLSFKLYPGDFCFEALFAGDLIATLKLETMDN